VPIDGLRHLPTLWRYPATSRYGALMRRSPTTSGSDTVALRVEITIMLRNAPR
jgi:hypothetical protein